MSNLCKAKKAKVKHDAAKVEEKKAEGKTTYVCEHCHRVSHKEDHLCKPEKVKAK